MSAKHYVSHPLLPPRTYGPPTSRLVSLSSSENTRHAVATRRELYFLEAPSFDICFMYTLPTLPTGSRKPLISTGPRRALANQTSGSRWTPSFNGSGHGQPPSRALYVPAKAQLFPASRREVDDVGTTRRGVEVIMNASASRHPSYWSMLPRPRT